MVYHWHITRKPSADRLGYHLSNDYSCRSHTENSTSRGKGVSSRISIKSRLRHTWILHLLESEVALWSNRPAQAPGPLTAPCFYNYRRSSCSIHLSLHAYWVQGIAPLFIPQHLQWSHSDSSPRHQHCHQHSNQGRCAYNQPT